MRVVIAEDDALLREGLALLLRHAGCTVPAATGDAETFLDAVRTHRPDVTVVDVRLPPSYRDEGLRAALRAREEIAGLPVLVLSQYVARDYAAELLGSGNAVGYLLKDRVSRVEEFVDALRRVAAGGTALDPDVVAQLLVRGPEDPTAGLTPREREVLALMAQGHDNRDIADRMLITGNAVHKHISNIFAKLGLDPADGGHRRVRAVLTYLGA
ncbi:response regulator transcription factor [Catenuloplanes atrovinosus]|uniref:DNA-binding NarL/FixJ family response regulator n=1 Tax=Catenuloplanes atrovinosus TaxID=137266 RepID=A0AAE4CB07_9ACTN|nr:response regulator transcription factor [Catenuloplanes atrovinosus]MDR7275130.1 DNA-binding NarL/FixJ family response regulator [Catenuloplanes atrovinosus]